TGAGRSFERRRSRSSGRRRRRKSSGSLLGSPLIGHAAGHGVVMAGALRHSATPPAGAKAGSARTPSRCRNRRGGWGHGRYPRERRRAVSRAGLGVVVLMAPYLRKMGALIREGKGRLGRRP